jgi:hypothetical protein
LGIFGFLILIIPPFTLLIVLILPNNPRINGKNIRTEHKHEEINQSHARMFWASMRRRLCSPFPPIPSMTGLPRASCRAERLAKWLTTRAAVIPGWCKIQHPLDGRFPPRADLWPRYPASDLIH